MQYKTAAWLHCITLYADGAVLGLLGAGERWDYQQLLQLHLPHHA